MAWGLLSRRDLNRIDCTTNRVHSFTRAHCIKNRIVIILSIHRNYTRWIHMYAHNTPHFPAYWHLPCSAHSSLPYPPTAAPPQLCDRYGTPIKEPCFRSMTQDISKLHRLFHRTKSAYIRRINKMSTDFARFSLTIFHWNKWYWHRNFEQRDET